jgi:hypothetical protein
VCGGYVVSPTLQNFCPPGLRCRQRRKPLYMRWQHRPTENCRCRGQPLNIQYFNPFTPTATSAGLGALQLFERLTLNDSPPKSDKQASKASDPPLATQQSASESSHASSVSSSTKASSCSTAPTHSLYTPHPFKPRCCPWQGPEGCEYHGFAEDDLDWYEWQAPDVDTEESALSSTPPTSEIAILDPVPVQPQATAPPEDPILARAPKEPKAMRNAAAPPNAPREPKAMRPAATHYNAPWGPTVRPATATERAYARAAARAAAGR